MPVGIGRLLPAPARSAIRHALQRAIARGASHTLASLHQPEPRDVRTPFYFVDGERLRQPREGSCEGGERVSDGGALPTPPARLRMGYAVESAGAYLEDGRRSARAVRELLAAHGVSDLDGEVALDWGCASGRVLRHFEAEASTGEWWGIDLHAPSVEWTKQNLSPPFHFATGTAFPALPFEDASFGLVYGLSVFTHLEHLEDAWLLELRRAVRAGGHLLFSVQDEASVEWMREKGRPAWLPAALELDAILEHERTVVHGESWGVTHVFHSRRWIEREWGRYFQVLDVHSCVEGHQSLVLLRRP